jgi:hypothetical protein
MADSFTDVSYYGKIYAMLLHVPVSSTIKAVLVKYENLNSTQPLFCVPQVKYGVGTPGKM